MTAEARPYWLRRPSKQVAERLLKIASICAGTVRTVRNITYRLYPNLHGKDLDRAYNTTVKDVVRARLAGLVSWDSIREERVTRRSPDGFRDRDAFVDSLVDPEFWRGYSLSRRPAHRRPIEVWFEKSTVEPEFARVCRRYDIPYLSTRGQLTFTAKRNADRLPDGHVVLYFGDNDEKGHEIRDVIERDTTYLGFRANLKWVCVTREQEERFGLPDGARLDGLELEDLESIIEEEVLRYVDQDVLAQIEREENRDLQVLRSGRLKFEEGEE